MEENVQQSKMKTRIKFLALFVVLVVLPIGTWYYTKAGFDYYKTMTAELQEYGQVPVFALKDHNGEVLKKENLKGRLVVAGFIDLNEPKSNTLASQTQKLYDQFKDRDDVVFIFFAGDSDANSISKLNDFAQANGLTDEEQCFFLSGSASEVNALLSNGYKWPRDYGKENRETPYELSSTSTNHESYYPYLVLADTSLTIRNYYAYEDNKSMARLVEHLAILLPNRGGGKPELRREEEK